MAESLPALPTLAGGTVRLRAMVAADAAKVFAIFSSPQVTRYWSSGPMREQAQAEALIAEIDDCARRGVLLQWGVTTLGSDDVVGTCTLAHLDPGQGRAEVGFALHPAHWGRGVMRMALRTLIGHAFATLGLRRLEADVDPRNLRSLHALETLGFRREGLLRERWLVDGEIQDSVLLGLLRSEWQAPS
jgi:RimJ/RimL family protein N-acetyltransferase